MSNSLSKVHPELISEWSDRNYPLKPDNITFGSTVTSSGKIKGIKKGTAKITIQAGAFKKTVTVKVK